MPKQAKQGKAYCKKCGRSYDITVFNLFHRHADTKNQFQSTSTQTDDVHIHHYTSQKVDGNIITTCQTCGDIKVVLQPMIVKEELFEKKEKKRVSFLQICKKY